MFPRSSFIYPSEILQECYEEMSRRQTVTCKLSIYYKVSLETINVSITFTDYKAHKEEFVEVHGGSLRYWSKVRRLIQNTPGRRIFTQVIQVYIST